MEEVDEMFCYSYGAVPGIFQDVTRARRYIFLAPALGVGTVKFGLKEKFFGLFLPGLKEMKDEKFQKQIFERLCCLRRNGSKIKFFLPCNAGTKTLEDEKVEYPTGLLFGHFDLFEKTMKSFPVNLHREMIRDPSILQQIFNNLESND
jgi:hypothetical protein